MGTERNATGLFVLTSFLCDNGEFLCARSLCFGSIMKKKNRHRERVPLRTERRHVGQLFEDH